jgi:hypothetical protein
MTVAEAASTNIYSSTPSWEKKKLHKYVDGNNGGGGDKCGKEAEKES